MESVYLDHGCERSAYAPIVGAGPNSTILHYARNSRRMDRGELLLMDVGAECAGYAADITRTIPVGAKFTPRHPIAGHWNARTYSGVNRKVVSWAIQNDRAAGAGAEVWTDGPSGHHELKAEFG